RNPVGQTSGHFRAGSQRQWQSLRFHFTTPPRYNPSRLISNRKLTSGGKAMMHLILAVLAMVGIPATESDSVTFSTDVLPILHKNCRTGHRSGQVAPMSLITYNETRPWEKAIKAAVATRKMPPCFADDKYGHFINDRSLKQADIDMIVKWVDSGAVEGDPRT